MKTTLVNAIGNMVKFKENGFLFQVLDIRNSNGWIAVKRQDDAEIWDFFAPWKKCIIIK